MINCQFSICLKTLSHQNGTSKRGGGTQMIGGGILKIVVGGTRHRSLWRESRGSPERAREEAETRGSSAAEQPIRGGKRVFVLTHYSILGNEWWGRMEDGFFACRGCASFGGDLM